MSEVNERIKAYLDERAAKDELFAKSYAKDNKSIDECLQFIIGEARKEAVNIEGGKGAFLCDEKVFGWAVHYYDEDDIKIAPVRGDVKVRTEKLRAPRKRHVEVNSNQMTLFDL